MTTPAALPLPAFGPRRVKDQLRNFMSANLPPTLAALRPLWGVQLEDVPDPVSYMRNEPQTLDVFPRIAASVRRLATHRRLEPTQDGEWMVYYNFVLYTWVLSNPPAPTNPPTTRDDDMRWEAVLDQRDYMMAAMRYALLSDLSLGAPPVGSFGVDEDSLVEDYTDPTAGRGDRWLAGGTLTGRVRVFEVVPGPTLGTVRQVTVDVAAQPTHTQDTSTLSIDSYNLLVHPALM